MFLNRFIKTKEDGEEPMADTIDVRDLPDEDVEIVEMLVERLKERAKRKKRAKRFNFDWEGGLSKLAGEMNSVELQHKSLKWR